MARQQFVGAILSTLVQKGNKTDWVVTADVTSGLAGSWIYTTEMIVELPALLNVDALTAMPLLEVRFRQEITSTTSTYPVRSQVKIKGAKEMLGGTGLGQQGLAADWYSYEMWTDQATGPADRRVLVQPVAYGAESGSADTQAALSIKDAWRVQVGSNMPTTGPTFKISGIKARWVYVPL